jgi:hypothetical protein
VVAGVAGVVVLVLVLVLVVVQKGERALLFPRLVWARVQAKVLGVRRLWVNRPGVAGQQGRQKQKQQQQGRQQARQEQKRQEEGQRQRE